MEFNEYMPACGWIKYRRRQKTTQAIKTAIHVLVIIAAYLIIGTMEYGG